jgi:hypothetical protein
MNSVELERWLLRIAQKHRTTCGASRDCMQTSWRATSPLLSSLTLAVPRIRAEDRKRMLVMHERSAGTEIPAVL